MLKMVSQKELTAEVYEKVREEIQNDPEKLGYEGKTTAEITNLLNNSVKKQRIVEDVFPSRINQILVRIANTPNILTEEEVKKILNI
ncbi:MAG: hypothetical protein ACOYWZ_00015 [Bacillota bacterium]